MRRAQTTERRTSQAIIFVKKMIASYIMLCNGRMDGALFYLAHAKPAHMSG